MSAIHFDPITLWVRDFDRCLTFYREVFELEVLRLKEGEHHAPHEWSAQMTADVASYLQLARSADGPIVELAVGNGRVAIPVARATGRPLIGIDRTNGWGSWTSRAFSLRRSTAASPASPSTTKVASTSSSPVVLDALRSVTSVR